MRSLLLAACLAASPAIAGPEMVYIGNGITVRLMLADCDVPELAHALREVPSLTPPKMATIKHGSSDFEVPACWGTAEGDKVLLGDILGNAGFIMKGSFKPAPGV
jgi:hypothetical protein